jgi:hypothetical protein
MNELATLWHANYIRDCRSLLIQEFNMRRFQIRKVQFWMMSMTGVNMQARELDRFRRREILTQDYVAIAKMMSRAA